MFFNITAPTSLDTSGDFIENFLSALLVSTLNVFILLSSILSKIACMDAFLISSKSCSTLMQGLI